MSPRAALAGQLMILAICLAASAYYAPRLPDVVPTHWDINGHIDGYGSKWLSLAVMPATLVFILALTFALPALSPKNFEVTRSGRAYTEIMLIVSALMGGIHFVILAGTTHTAIDMNRWLFAGIFLFIALIGNVFGKIKRNFYMGIRTPWTLADERVWTETHRVGGRIWFALGFIGLALALVGVPPAALITLLVLLSLAPVVLSYTIYKKLVH